jgi:hypothetical protein
VDRFGNVQLDAEHGDLIELGLGMGSGVELTAGGDPAAAHYVRTFADVAAGELLLYEDADRALAVAVSHGSASERLGVAAGDELWVRSV